MFLYLAGQILTDFDRIFIRGKSFLDLSFCQFLKKKKKNFYNQLGEWTSHIVGRTRLLENISRQRNKKTHLKKRNTITLEGLWIFLFTSSFYFFSLKDDEERDGGKSIVLEGVSKADVKMYVKRYDKGKGEKDTTKVKEKKIWQIWQITWRRFALMDVSTRKRKTCLAPSLEARIPQSRDILWDIMWDILWDIMIDILWDIFCDIQGVFFNWYPPKKLKYGKPRLGESTLT